MSESAEIILAEANEDAGLSQTSAAEGQTAAVQSQTKELTARQLKNRRIWLGVLSLIYLVSFLLPRSELPHVPLCWLNATTGLPCPTCGLTRGFLDIGHGQFAAATELNVMAVPVYLLGLTLIGVLIYELRSGRDLLCPWARRHRWALILLCAVSVLIRYLPMIPAL